MDGFVIRRWYCGHSELIGALEALIGSGYGMGNEFSIVVASLLFRIASPYSTSKEPSLRYPPKGQDVRIVPALMRFDTRPKEGWMAMKA